MAFVWGGVPGIELFYTPLFILDIVHILYIARPAQYMCRISVYPFESVAFIVLFPQNSGNEELSAPADHVSCHHPGNQEKFAEPPPPSAYPPVTLLPHNPYTQHPTNTPMYTFQPNSAPSAPRPPFNYPKEQSV